MTNKRKPLKHDSHAKVERGEPCFVLLARDILAPIAESWALMRAQAIRQGRASISDLVIVEEALLCAAAMRQWRHEHHGNGAAISMEGMEAEALVRQMRVSQIVPMRREG